MERVSLMKGHVLIAGNINWFNLREKHIKPLLQAGLKITVISDVEPDKPQYVTGLSFIHLNNPKHSLATLFSLIKLVLSSLIKGVLFSKKERRRIIFLYKNALMYIPQIRGIDFKKFDLVHCHFLTRPVCVAVISSVIPVPILASIHGSDLYVSSKNTNVDLQIIYRFFNKSVSIQVPGSSEKKCCIALGCNEKKVIALPWSVNTNNFFPLGNKSEVTTLRAEWGIGEASKIFVSVRNLSPIYNVEMIMNAFQSYANNQSQDSILLICGSGNLDTQLKSLAASMEHPNRIRFLGKLTPKQLLEVYQLSDVYVQNPLSDALPYSILESIICGLPIICGEIGSITDIKEELIKSKIKRFFYSGSGVLNETELQSLFQLAIDSSVKRYATEVNSILKIYSEELGTMRTLKLYKHFSASKNEFL